MSTLSGALRRGLVARGAAGLGAAAAALPSRALASARATPAAWSLVVSMLAVWVVERAVLGRVHGGRPIGYLSLGALPNVTVAGRGGAVDWWRYVSSALLHQSPLHLAGNVIGVLVVATMAERIHGGLVTLGVFTATSAATGAVFVAAGGTGLIPLGTFTLGASGGLCGLIGLLVMYARRPHPPAERPLAAAAAIRAVTITCLLLLSGVLFTGVNNLAHAAGLVCGMVLGIGVPPVPALAGGRRLRGGERGVLALVLMAALVALGVAVQHLSLRLLQP